MQMPLRAMQLPRQFISSKVNKVLQAFAVYLLSGALLLGLTALLGRRLRKDEEVSELVKLARQMPAPEPQRLSHKLKEWAIYPLMWLIWPVAMLLAIQALLKLVGFQLPRRLWGQNSQTGNTTVQQEIKFICQPPDLIKPIEPEQAEVTSYVTDPLGRVPDQPFGHLHLGWSQLLSHLEPKDTLWQFKSPKRDYEDACTGLAVLRKNKVIAEFIYERHP